MRAFSALLDRLSLTAGRNAKLTLVRDYLRATPDPNRGYALGALTGDLTFSAAKPAMIRTAVERRMDPVLFGWSYDYVGDLAEAVALAWPAQPGAPTTHGRAAQGGEFTNRNCRRTDPSISTTSVELLADHSDGTRKRRSPPSMSRWRPR